MSYKKKLLFRPTNMGHRTFSTFPPFSNFLTFLTPSKTFPQIKQIHAQLIITSLIQHPIPTTKFLNLLINSNPSYQSYAHKVFEQIPHPDIFLYNTMIKASSSDPFVTFRSMVRDPNVVPNQYTFVFTIKGLGMRVCECEQVCVHAVKVGLDRNVFVVNVVIKMYADLEGGIGMARKLFDYGSGFRDLYSWNTMIGGYVSVGDVDKARELFDEMPVKDVVSWSTMVSGYVQASCFMEGIEVFRDMLLSGPPPNEFTLVSALAACANLLALDQGKWIHVYVVNKGFKINGRLLAGLVDMYAKCGEIEFAYKIFNSSRSCKLTVWPWNAMIGGFAMHGRSQEAIDLFEKMITTSYISPNKVTFISLLTACSHGNLVEEGKKYFNTMASDHGVEPEIEHYGCMVDLLGRAGLLKEAEDMVLTMPIAPDTTIWGALLGACRIHRNTEMGERIGRVIRKQDPNNMGCHVLLANMYSASGRWTEAKVAREGIQLGDAKKTPGCTSIELSGTVHQFLVGDRSHPQTEQIYMFLEEMMARLKHAGYIPELGEVLLDIYDEEEKETALSRHSEKLAIAFGIINTAPRTPIRIMKNLRVCGDCHEASKFVSKVYNREIIVRDRLRFHHFRDGVCSCNDYW